MLVTEERHRTGKDQQLIKGHFNSNNSTSRPEPVLHHHLQPVATAVYSSTFNTVLPQRPFRKLSNLGLSSSLCAHLDIGLPQQHNLERPDRRSRLLHSHREHRHTSGMRPRPPYLFARVPLFTPVKSLSNLPTIPIW